MGSDFLDKNEIEPSVCHISKPGLLKVLGELEAEVMTLIWERSGNRGVTVRDVHETLQQRRAIAYTTVMTTMARLAKKKILRVQKREQPYVYYPSVSETEFTSRFVGQILDQLLTSFSGATIAHFAAKAEPEQRDAVARLLQDIIERQKEDEPAP